MKTIVLAVMLAALPVAGCSGPNANQDTGTIAGAVLGGIVGNQFGKGGGKVAATMAGAVVGGIVGNEIGRKLDDRDRMLAREAEYEAWERGPPGRPVKWRNPDNGRYGEIVAESDYDRGGRRCRNFYHRVYIDGRPETMRGTACRNPDGTWNQV
ncbi:MAG: RT0821/Lpp0805 family surface protein [Hyphomicrobiaceae bacterium]|nr:RT0821/Lpp0805 family surface protein [Hyphomicrobiaceae bacterium]